MIVSVALPMNCNYQGWLASYLIHKRHHDGITSTSGDTWHKHEESTHGPPSERAQGGYQYCCYKLAIFDYAWDGVCGVAAWKCDWTWHQSNTVCDQFSTQQ